MYVILSPAPNHDLSTTTILVYAKCPQISVEIQTRATNTPILVSHDQISNEQAFTTELFTTKSLSTKSNFFLAEFWAWCANICNAWLRLVLVFDNRLASTIIREALSSKALLLGSLTRVGFKVASTLEEAGV